MDVSPRKRKRRQPEADIQRAVIAHLEARGAKGLVYFHPANGGYRRPVEAAIMKALGVRAGVSDLIFLHRSRFYALELKSAGGQLSASQRLFSADVQLAGGKWHCADNLDDAIKQLESWQLLHGRVM